MNIKDILNNQFFKILLNIIKGIEKIQILQPAFWFRNPGATSLTSVEISTYLVFFGLVFLIGISILVVDRWRIKNYPPKNRILRPAGWGLFGFGLTGIIFTLIRSQGVTFLGVRFFPAAFALASIIWAVYFLCRYFKNLPAEVVKYEAKALKRKYLGRRYET